MSFSSPVFFILPFYYQIVDSICSFNQTSPLQKLRSVFLVRLGTQWLKPFSGPAVGASVLRASCLVTRTVTGRLLGLNFCTIWWDLFQFFLNAGLNLGSPFSHGSSSSSGLGLSIDTTVRDSPVPFLHSSERDP